VAFIGQGERVGFSALRRKARGKTGDPVVAGSKTPMEDGAGGGRGGRTAWAARGERTIPKASGLGSVRQGETWGLGMRGPTWGPGHRGRQGRHTPRGRNAVERGRVDTARRHLFFVSFNCV
jgi:hypothetical protein